jgi:hypothetical protein
VALISQMRQQMMNIFRRRPKCSPQKLAPQDQEITELEGCLNALAASSTAPIRAAEHDPLVTRHGERRHQTATTMDDVAGGLYRLAGQAARGAVQLDPNALLRILERMQNLGDATLRQIEGRIGVTISRDDRKELQDLRDAVRDWLVARDDEREKAQQAADELSVHATALREKSLAESRRLANAAEIASRAGAILKARPRASSSEAAAFAASLRAFLTALRASTRH